MSSALWDGVREGCGTCAFGTRREWKGTDDIVRVSVQCRRFPPSMIPVSRNDGYGNLSWDVEQHHPTQEQHDWCGAYKRKLS